MKHLILLLLAFGSVCQAQSTFFYLDFGPNDGNNGNATASPDANGNHWNNPTNASAAAPAVQLIDVTGAASGASLTVSSAMSTNGINHGGLLAPTEDLLGELAVATATQDYFFTNGTGSLTFSGLDPDKGYVFSLFASRNTPEVRESGYLFTGANEVTGSLQSSGPNLGGGNYNGNNSTLYTSETVLPAADGTITLTVSRNAGQFAYVNLMTIEELGSSGVDVTGITVTGDDITVQGETRRMEATVAPDDATFRAVSWSVDDPTIAEITDTGELLPLRNGAVTVTATSLQPGVDVSGSATVAISNQEINHYFVDFGTEVISTASPDNFGNAWNNLTDPTDTASPLGLTNARGEVSALELAVTRSVVTGVEGGLDAPQVADLGELANASATADFFRTSNFGIVTFRNLDPDAAYQLRVLGSASNTGPRETTYTVEGFNASSGVVKTSGTGTSGPGTTQNTDNVFRSARVFPSDSGTISLTYRVTLGAFGYVNTLRLSEYPGVELCPERDERGIVVMGSSVARGQGAPGDMGYAFQYGELLADRADAGDGLDWELTNISVGGNNTVAVADRWARDLAPLCDEYVVYGLSLANEGIRTRGQEAFDDFRDNMLALIERARERGIQPVVVGNYSRRDFNATDYAFIREMNLLIHQWDVPSVNVLGTNDNGSGNWVQGFEADLGHPNLAGHTEFFHAFVPSLFDALDAGKPLPERSTTVGVLVGAEVDPMPVTFTPEETVHSYTVSVEFRTDGTGQLLEYESDDGTNFLSLTPGGNLELVTPTGLLSSAAVVNDNAWHTATVTHYYARATTQLYLDGVSVGGDLDGRQVTTEYALAGAAAVDSFFVRNLFFYRSGMNADEIGALHAGAMLKSSLEIYVPFEDRTAVGEGFSLENLAQSTNAADNSRLSSTEDATRARATGLTYYPNPVDNLLHLTATDGGRLGTVAVFDAQGKLVRTAEHPEAVRMGDLAVGLYLVRVTRPDGRKVTLRIVRR